MSLHPAIQALLDAGLIEITGEHHDETQYEEVPLHGRDADLEEFIEMVRNGEPAPLDLIARLTERGLDLDRIESAVTQ